MASESIQELKSAISDLCAAEELIRSVYGTNFRPVNQIGAILREHKNWLFMELGRAVFAGEIE